MKSREQARSYKDAWVASMRAPTTEPASYRARLNAS